VCSSDLSRKRQREGTQRREAMVRCYPSGRLMTRAQYRAIYRAVLAEREDHLASLTPMPILSEEPWLTATHVVVRPWCFDVAPLSRIRPRLDVLDVGVVCGPY
jgi:hypothetical protein